MLQGKKQPLLKLYRYRAGDGQAVRCHMALQCQHLHSSLGCLPECLPELRMSLVIGRESGHTLHLNHKAYCGLGTRLMTEGQFPQMFYAALGGGVGEQGQTILF